MREPISELSRNTRRLSRVLLKVTLLITLGLGVLAALVQLWIDLDQEKHAVEVSATEFLSSVAPSAASAAYNFYDQAAIQVADGLFTQRAITAVEIINGSDVMISRQRSISRTLPEIGNITSSDEVRLSEDLFTPIETGQHEKIGEISIVVDRSVVPPAIVNRMFSYFLLSTLKNVVLGFLLIAIVYGALARHIISLADVTGGWAPSLGKLNVPPPPKFLQSTELSLLGQRIEQLSDTAEKAIEELEDSRRAVLEDNTQLSRKSEGLSLAVEERTAELRAANQRLTELAEQDGLTGLLNRRTFDGLAQIAFEAANAEKSDLSILLIDVDFFKGFNDHYGHQAGDTALIEVSEVIKARAGDPRFDGARYGGEEFVMLLRDCDETAAREIANAIHDGIRGKAIENARSPVSDLLTASIGLATLSFSTPGEEEITLDELLAASDEALYEAKRTGRSKTEVSNTRIRDRVRRQRSEAQTLKDAVQGDAFEPFFQPQYDVSTGALVGAETLVRWRRVDGSIVAASGFLNAAAENGLVQFIDRIVARKVADFLTVVANEKAVLDKVSLNFPPEAANDEDFVSAIVELTDKFDTRIGVELLETAFIDEPDTHLMWQIDRMREAGAEIEIDDFGTGHTSIASLNTFSPRLIKIARQLVQPIEGEIAQLQIVKSLIDIGNALNIDILAEGVESAEMAEMLADIGCPLQQGYFHGMPMDARAFLDSLHGQSSQTLTHTPIGQAV